MCKCSLSPHSAMSAYSHFSCLHCWYSSVVAFLCVAEEKTCFLFCLVSEQQLFLCCDSSQLMLFTRAILLSPEGASSKKLPQSIVNSQQVQVRNKRYTTLISTLQRLDYIIHRITREHQTGHVRPESSSLFLLTSPGHNNNNQSWVNFFSADAPF